MAQIHRLTTAVLPGLLAMTAGCGPKDDTPPAEEPPPATTEVAAPTAIVLPEAIQAALRQTYAMEGAETRYVAAKVDLNGDGSDEYVAYLLGPMACGTGGCNTVVFSADRDGWASIGDIPVTRTPIRVSPRATDGWSNLIVGIGGGGGASGAAEVAHGAKGYAANPTGAGATKVDDLTGATTIIEAADFSSGQVLSATGGS